MSEFRNHLQEKVNKRRERAQKELTAEERLQQERQNLNEAFVFLEKATSEAREGWYLESCRELTGRGLKEKLNCFRKKVQRKSLHWYLEPVCDDQSAYNWKMLQALAAMEDFAKAQINWNNAMEARYKAEIAALRKEVSAAKGEASKDEG